jgi:hypothetical protein
MTENELIDQIYSLYEGDVDMWDTDSDEYLLARNFLNAGVNRWRYYEQTDWKELFVNLADAADGDKTTVASTFDYDCPSDFVKPTSYVKIGTNVFKTYTSARATTLIADENTDAWCYFSGNPKDGYDLHVNPNFELDADLTISYSYYKTPTEFSSTTDVPEMSDPYFLVYYALYRLYKNDSEAFNDEFTNAEARLEQMRVNNIAGIEELPDEIEWNNEFQEGFGY